MGVPFDKVTHTIEEFVNANSEEFHQIKLSVKDEVYSPFKEHTNTWLSISASESLISTCRDIAIEKIELLVKNYATEMWYIIIRRFPNNAFPNPTWHYYCTLAALKWSTDQNIFSTGYYNIEKPGTQEASFAITNELLFDALRLASYCDCLANLTNKQRWIGKGLKLFVDAGLNLILSNDQAVIESVRAYEARRPKNMMFEETGNPYLSFKVTKAEILFLTDTIDRLPIYIPKSNLTLFFNRFPNLVNVESMLEYLGPYREAIFDLYHIKIEAIIQTYYALSQLIISTIPFDQIDFLNGKIILNSDPSKPEDNHRLHFFFGICHKAYLRFQLNYLKSQLSIVHKHPLIATEKTTKELIEDFFNTFLLDESKKNSIDLLQLNNPPIIFLNQDGMCYWDLQYFYDFFRGLIEKSKNWFASQHGDRFTLTIKSYLQKELQELNVIFFNKVMYFRNEKFEIDLLIHYKSKIFLIEAKAYAKNRDFWNGYRHAITDRSAKINEAVKQVSRANELLHNCIKNGAITNLPEHNSIEWVLCFPEQEFLHPLDKFGTINGIPRVCTLEELVRIINC
ncbi:MAG: NERD domain-containing protein [Ferruginibacter sp.]